MNVLDHGSLDLMLVHGDDKLVVNAARVSFANADWLAQFDDKKDSKLITYLGDHRHVSPFYHPQLTFRVKAPISVQRQAFKHKIGTAENSESTRYTEIKREYYTPERFRLQSKDRKQGSEGYTDSVMVKARYRAGCESAFDAYQSLIEADVAREIARDVLPLATYTSWVWTMSLAACAHFISLRDTDDAQYEIRQYGIAMKKLAKPFFPHSLKALLKGSE